MTPRPRFCSDCGRLITSADERALRVRCASCLLGRLAARVATEYDTLPDRPAVYWPPRREPVTTDDAAMAASREHQAEHRAAE